MIIVAFGHKSRVGKDTSAKLLETALRLAGRRTKKVSFAAKLKQASHLMFAWAGLREAAYYETEEGAKARAIKLPSVNMTPVEIWVEVGNKIREIYQDVWLNATLLEEANGIDVLIITDLRFPNEGDKVNELGGIPVWIQRPDAVELNTVSDKALDGWTGWKRVILNNGTLKDLNLAILGLVKELI